MKRFLVMVLFLLGANAMNAQISLEQQVADSACICLSAIDTAKIKSGQNGLKMACLQKAMVQNQEAIVKQQASQQRKEEDEAKMGLKGSIMIKVQNILAVSCPAYQLFEKKIQQKRRTP